MNGKSELRANRQKRKKRGGISPYCPETSRLQLLTFRSRTPTISANGHALPTRGADGFPLPHPQQDRRWGHGCGLRSRRPQARSSRRGCSWTAFEHFYILSHKKREIEGLKREITNLENEIAKLRDQESAESVRLDRQLVRRFSLFAVICVLLFGCPCRVHSKTFGR